jgi:mRNA-degrading endonuclease toxin of MazEF toxin-antitoxin module
LGRAEASGSAQGEEEEEEVKQYEIWWAALPEPAGRRPVLLLTRDSAYEYLSAFVVAEITTRVRYIPQEVTVGKNEGLSRRSAANLDRIRAVHRSLLETRIGTIP